MKTKKKALKKDDTVQSATWNTLHTYNTPTLTHKRTYPPTTYVYMMKNVYINKFGV